MAKLYLDGLFKSFSDSPSTILLNIPVPYSSSPEQVAGLLASDITLSAQNTWGPIVNDISNLTDFSSMMGSTGMFSWIGASTMCWKGTKPLTLNAEFYLINYRQTGLNLEKKLTALMKLASLYEDKKATALGRAIKVQVHGGYAADVLETNSDYWSASRAEEIEKKKGEVDDSVDPLFDDKGNAQGTVSLTVGNKIRVRNILLSKIDVTPSITQVADSNGGNSKPLYYRVQASFIGVRALLDADVEKIFDF